MNKYFFIVMVVLPIISTGCKQVNSESKQKLEEIDSLKSLAMEIHDEVMPKMSTIEKLQSQLKRHLDTLADDSLAQIQYLDLKTADKAMWDWMYQYKSDTNADIKVQKAYYTHQLKTIRDVAIKMNQSIHNAQNTMKNE